MLTFSRVLCLSLQQISNEDPTNRWQSNAAPMNIQRKSIEYPTNVCRTCGGNLSRIHRQPNEHPNRSTKSPTNIFRQANERPVNLNRNSNENSSTIQRMPIESPTSMQWTFIERSTRVERTSKEHLSKLRCETIYCFTNIGRA